MDQCGLGHFVDERHGGGVGGFGGVFVTRFDRFDDLLQTRTKLGFAAGVMQAAALGLSGTFFCLGGIGQVGLRRNLVRGGRNMRIYAQSVNPKIE
jgi:hypothetical protein